MKAEIVIPVIDKILSQFGTPSVIRSDNGAPFNSSQFQDYANYMGFTHRKITPYHPRANGEVERFMRTLNKTIRAAIIENKNWTQELYKFLRNYRSTPHCSTKISPYESLFNRKVKNRLPIIISNRKSRNIFKNDENSKQKMARNYTEKLKPKNCNLQIGHNVLLRNK